MRILFISAIAVAIFGGSAAADATLPIEQRLDLTNAPKQDAAFRRWVRKQAQERGWALSRWGWLQLDADRLPERFAIVCKGDEDGAVILIEDTPAKRWSIARETDGRNSCNSDENPKWERDAPPALELTFNYHGGEDTTYVALRRGQPTIVNLQTNEHHFHGETDCIDDVTDFDTLERRYDTCDLDKTGDKIVPTGSTRSALFVIDGGAGQYRHTLAGTGETPPFDVTVRSSGKRLAVMVKLGRPARTGEGVEVWTTGSAGKTLAWSASWDGTRWQLRGLLRAPRELPPIDGDATTMTLPIVRRSNGSEEQTALTVVAVSADGATRVASSDLRADDAGSLGLVVLAPGPPADLRAE